MEPRFNEVPRGLRKLVHYVDGLLYRGFVPHILKGLAEEHLYLY